MPRHAWAKVYCDLLRHPKIIRRPDSDVRLFVGLILYAKEYAPDTGVVDLSADEMRGTFGIKAPLKAVEQGLDYFVAQGVLVRNGPFIQIRDFAARQAADSLADRQQRWRDRNKSGVTKRYAGVLPASTETSTAPSTQTSTATSTSAFPDVEVEVDQKHVDSSKSGESEGREITACESVNNSGSQPADTLGVTKALAQIRERSERGSPRIARTSRAPRQLRLELMSGGVWRLR